LPGDDDAAVAQDADAVAEGLVGDAVVAGEVSLGGEQVGELASLDAGLECVGDLEVGGLGLRNGSSLSFMA
jgi:hypothetical protein